MYSYISGQIVNVENNLVTIDVNGIGYVHCVLVYVLALCFGLNIRSSTLF